MKAQASRASKYNCELASLCGVVAEESTDPTLVFLKIDGRRKPSGVKDNVDVSGVSGVTDSNPLCIRASIRRCRSGIIRALALVYTHSVIHLHRHLRVPGGQYLGPEISEGRRLDLERSFRQSPGRRQAYWL
jgi:hypothetical protein